MTYKIISLYDMQPEHVHPIEPKYSIEDFIYADKSRMTRKIVDYLMSKPQAQFCACAKYCPGMDVTQIIASVTPAEMADWLWRYSNANANIDILVQSLGKILTTMYLIEVVDKYDPDSRDLLEKFCKLRLAELDRERPFRFLDADEGASLHPPQIGLQDRYETEAAPVSLAEWYGSYYDQK